jgi:hypothetical protein
MSIHSGSMKLRAPVGNSSTADSIHFLVRPHLAQLGVQCWGLTKTLAPSVYEFSIEVEGRDWEEVTQKIEGAHRSLLATFGLQVL